ncbi:hypothetical protein PROFUN_06533 [Planoprotostelium fungivorum]|uniref:Uncharacterized protein n=1 Tax=Planoprotostelium fungivorum TaxID=1890364 RepID=A0A2P6NP15_9EUKA|nr:hypothetical protein PROFUN_06533 [Planoprotostelium fungivorum]
MRFYSFSDGFCVPELSHANARKRDNYYGKNDALARRSKPTELRELGVRVTQNT